jgi:hypothetical protein
MRGTATLLFSVFPGNPIGLQTADDRLQLFECAKNSTFPGKINDL